MGDILQRTCIGCNLKGDKKDFIRIVRNSMGELQIDDEYKVQGRGAYICNNVECVKKAVKKKKLERIFNKNNLESFYNELINKIENN